MSGLFCSQVECIFVVLTLSTFWLSEPLDLSMGATRHPLLQLICSVKQGLQMTILIEHLHFNKIKKKRKRIAMYLVLFSFIENDLAQFLFFHNAQLYDRSIIINSVTCFLSLFLLCPKKCRKTKTCICTEWKYKENLSRRSSKRKE